MTENHRIKMHWSFWVVCIIGLLWNIGGSINYLLQTNPDFVSSMPSTHQAIILGRPAWATAGFAIGVFGGALGCVLLMLRMQSAIYLFALSFLGIVATMIHTLNVARSGTEFTSVEIFVMALMPLLVAVALVVYAWKILEGPGDTTRQ